MKCIKHCFSYKYCEMRKLFCVMFISNLLQLSVLPCFDFQEEKQCSQRYNMRSASFDTNKDMLHSGQSPYRVQTAVGEEISETYNWHAQCSGTFLALPSQCTKGNLLCCCSLASQPLSYSEQLCSCAANAHFPTFQNNISFSWYLFSGCGPGFSHLYHHSMS